jgi:DNA polymerase III subunit delta
MKPNANEIEQIIKVPPSNIFGYLIYGPDHGLVIERSIALEKQLVTNPFALTIIPFSHIKKNTGILIDALSNIAFGGGNNIIKITDCPETITAEIKAIIAKDYFETHIIMIAGELAPASSLRKFCETDKKFAAIPCYHDEKQQVRRIISDFFRNKQLICSNDAMSYLEQNLTGDRAIIRSELEKLAIYLGDNKNISLNHVQHIIGEMVEHLPQELCNDVFSGNINNISSHYNSLIKQDIPILNIIRFHLRYLHQLYEIKIHDIRQQDAAIKNLRPAIFFKQLPIFKQHLKLMSIESMVASFEILLDIEIYIKNNYLTNNFAVENSLYQIANLTAK